MVTETDEAVERFVKDILVTKYPHYKSVFGSGIPRGMSDESVRFIGEESDVNEPLTDEPTFICDPIDGFVREIS